MVLENLNSSVSVIIPSLNGGGQQIIHHLESQTKRPDEIEVVVGVRPNGRARNIGVDRTSGGILVFIDDDALPGSTDLIEKLVLILERDDHVGVAGAARVLPTGATSFQKRVAYEIPRTVNPIPQSDLETNPPLKGYGHSLITTTCCAIRRQLFEEVGRFSEEAISGVDTDLFYRIRKAGYKFIMAADTFVEHPAPANLSSLWKKFYWYGLGYGQETLRQPERKMGINLNSRIKRLLFLTLSTIWLLPNIFFVYSLGYPKFEIGFRPLKAFSTYAVAWGYAKAWGSGDQKIPIPASTDVNLP